MFPRSFLHLEGDLFIWAEIAALAPRPPGRGGAGRELAVPAGPGTQAEIHQLFLKDTIGTCEDSSFIGHFIFLSLQTFFGNAVPASPGI